MLAAQTGAGQVFVYNVEVRGLPQSPFKGKGWPLDILSGDATVATNGGQNLTYRIVEALGVAIVSGAYSIKNPFPIEAELCIQYGASRSVLREAVKMITAKGLLSARPRQGTWVQPEEAWNLLDPDVLRWLLERKPTYALLREFAQVRLAVEPKAAALAARVATPETKAAIRLSI